MLRRHQAHDAARPWRRIRGGPSPATCETTGPCRLAIARDALGVVARGSARLVDPRRGPSRSGRPTIGRSAIHERTTLASWSGCEKLMACAAPSMTTAVTCGRAAAALERAMASLMSGSRDPITASIGIRIPAKPLCGRVPEHRLASGRSRRPVHTGSSPRRRWAPSRTARAAPRGSSCADAATDREVVLDRRPVPTKIARSTRSGNWSTNSADDRAAERVPEQRGPVHTDVVEEPAERGGKGRDVERLRRPLAAAEAQAGPGRTSGTRGASRQAVGMR